MKETISGFCGVAGSVIAAAFGGWNTALSTLVIFMAVDYISGIAVAGVFHTSPKSEHGGLASYAGLKGLARKGMMLVLILVGTRIDLIIGASYVKDGICIALIINELTSIIENAGLMGVPIPEVFKEAIDVLKTKSEKDKKN